MPACAACGVTIDDRTVPEGATCPACGAPLEARTTPKNQWLVDQPGVEPYHYMTSTGRRRPARSPLPPRPAPADDQAQTHAEPETEPD